jgi:hypothetical protein
MRRTSKWALGSVEPLAVVVASGGANKRCVCLFRVTSHAHHMTVFGCGGELGQLIHQFQPVN